uniref:Uncharacterized protein n=1 Tax=Myoviridae sp. ctNQV2 TaxID=2827683 RepID=A0A8S5S045_9CAUD|nr:MAG TPA: hypothetical protein [Myoviridae sp. ctNQV2]
MPFYGMLIKHRKHRHMFALLHYCVILTVMRANCIF